MINSKSQKSNTGYKGIVFDKRYGLFTAQIVIREQRGLKLIYIGRFETVKQAVKAREDFIKSLF